MAVSNCYCNIDIAGCSETSGLGSGVQNALRIKFGRLEVQSAHFVWAYM